jgi:hypothetical protein
MVLNVYGWMKAQLAMASKITKVYGRDGCALSGSPIKAGDSIKVICQHNEHSKLSAETIWFLDLEIKAGDCTEPTVD